MTKKSDVWAFGITTWQVFAVKTPYWDILKDSNSSIEQLIKNGATPTMDAVSEPVQKFLQLLLHQSPDRRSPAMGCLEELEALKLE